MTLDPALADKRRTSHVPADGLWAFLMSVAAAGPADLLLSNGRIHVRLLARLGRDR